MKHFAPLLIAILSSTSWAGNKVGNGGDVLRCGEKTQLLDFFEANDKGRKLITAGPQTNYSAFLNDRLSALASLAPKLAAQYRQRADKIGEEIEFKAGVALSDVPDSLHASVPENCNLKQIAIRQGFVVEGDKRFVIDKNLWEKLDKTNQAGLILHEIIFEHFSKLGAWDSRKARRLNALIFSPELSAMSSGKFWLFMKELSIPVYP